MPSPRRKTDELADDLFPAQHFGDGQHEIGGRCAFGQLAGELDADDVGRQEVNRLPEHAGFRFDAADTPADDADAVDHRRVAVRADERIGIVDAVLRVDAGRKVLEVNLVHDADAGRHDLEGIERLHAPLHELVALGVAVELELHVEIERRRRAVVVDHHRVVDDEVDRHERLEELWITPEVGGDIAHRREIAQQRDAGEILQHDARDDERNLVGARGVRRPVRDLAHVLLGDLLPVAVAEHALEHDADRDRQPRHLADACGFERRQRVVAATFAGRQPELLQRTEKIVRHRVLRPSSSVMRAA